MTKEFTMNRIATLNMMLRIVGETRCKYLLFQWGMFYRERKTNSVFEAITQSMTYISFRTIAEDDELCVEIRILSI